MFRISVAFLMLTCLTRASQAQDFVLQGGQREAAVPWDSRELLPAQAEVPASASKITATVLRIKSGDETFEILTGPTGQVNLSVRGGAKASERFRVKGNLFEIVDSKGNVVLEVEPLAGSPGGMLGPVSVEASRTPRPDRAYLGVVVAPADPTLAVQLSVKPEEVVVVSSVVGDSPAERAGLRAHDILVELDGAKPANEKVVRERIARKKPGDPMALDILRGGRPLRLEATLGTAPNKVAEDLPALARTPFAGQFEVLPDIEVAERFKYQAESEARASREALAADLAKVAVVKRLAEQQAAEAVRRDVEAERERREAKLQELMARLEKRLAELEAKLAESEARTKK
jgi:hypothetical protein